MKHYEVEAAVVKAKNGDTEALTKLIESFKGYIYKTAYGFRVKNYELEDLIQIGNAAVINAVKKYTTGGSTFTPYVCNAIKNTFNYIARQNTRYQEEVSLNTPIDTGYSDTTEMIDLIKDPLDFEEEFTAEEGIQEVRKAMMALSLEELEFITMVYYNKASIKTYAIKKGLSYQQAIRKRNNILKKLRELLVN